MAEDGSATRRSGPGSRDGEPASSLLLKALTRPGPLVTVELRLPSAELEAEESMGAWIDLHHELRRLTGDELFVFLTDNAVGAREEESLAHVGANLGQDVDLRRIVPILTCKHRLDYCLMFASRAVSEGFDSMVVLGGDRDVGPPRCVPHARDLREMLSARVPALTKGGWVNPHKDVDEQVGWITAQDAHVSFALSQIVSHHSVDRVEALLRRMEEVAPGFPVVFGVFLYRSANPRTLETLGRFFPVPAEELAREFGAGATPEEVCARSIRALREIGAEKIYVSNLGRRGAARRLKRILSLI